MECSADRAVHVRLSETTVAACSEVDALSGKATAARVRPFPPGLIPAVIPSSALPAHAETPLPLLPIIPLSEAEVLEVHTRAQEVQGEAEAHTEVLVVATAADLPTEVLLADITNKNQVK